VKALLASILLLTAADWGLNHGAISLRVVHGIGGFFGASSSETRSSVFAK
jgi:hypothetical protein